MQAEREEKFWNPYFAGIALGLVLLTAFVIMGQGLGGSGAVYRFGVTVLATIAPEHVADNAYMAKAVAQGKSPLDNYFIFLVVGMFLGGVVSSFASGRMGRRIIRGPRIGVPGRLALALIGGMIMGYAARLTRGCTSGQALSGGAMLSVGSWIFMLSVFAGGYALAYFVRKEWT